MLEELTLWEDEVFAYALVPCGFKNPTALSRYVRHRVLPHSDNTYRDKLLTLSHRQTPANSEASLRSLSTIVVRPRTFPRTQLAKSA